LIDCIERIGTTPRPPTTSPTTPRIPTTTIDVLKLVRVDAAGDSGN